MSYSRFARIVLIAGISDFFCQETGGLGPSFLIIIAGMTLILLGRQGLDRHLSGFVPWLYCTAAFATWCLALMPWSHFPPINVAMATFCPVFGTAIFAFECLVSQLCSNR